jgi:hypothetical protein
MKQCTLSLRGAIGLCASFATLISCSAITSLVPESTQPAMKKVTGHITIDDKVIDEGDAYAVIDPVWWTANIYDGWQEYEKSLKIFSQEQRYLFAITWHIAEVNNGGHDQFYFNSTGIVWQDALAGYKAIGLKEAADILEESTALMGGSPSLDRRTRQEQLDTLQPNFEDLDNQFFSLQETVDFNEIMMTYIKHHREAFYFDGNVEKYELPNY